MKMVSLIVLAIWTLTTQQRDNDINDMSIDIKCRCRYRSDAVDIVAEYDIVAQRYGNYIATILLVSLLYRCHIIAVIVLISLL